MDNTIDKLQIIIEAEAGNASSGLDHFINSLAQIKDLNASDTSGLVRISTAFKDLSSAFKKISDIPAKVGSVKTAVEGFQNIDVSGLKTLVGEFEKLNGISDMTEFSKGINTMSNALGKMEKLDVTNITNQIKKLVEAIKPLTDEMIRGGERVGAYGEQMLAFVTASKKAAAAQVSYAKAEKMTKTGTGGVLGGLFSTLKGIKNSAIFTFVAKGVKEISRAVAQSLSDVSDYVEALNLFNVSMGEFAEKAGSFVEEMELKLGANAAEVSKNIGTFMSLAKSFGVAGDQAYLMSKNLTQLAYDYSSFFNISVEDAYEKLRSGFVGEIEPMRAIGKDLSVARLQQELYNMGINAQVENLTQADKAMLRYIVTLKQSGDQMNDLARTIESPTNMIRMLNSQFQILSRTIGSIFLPALSAILPYAIAVVKVLTQVAQAIANFFGATIPEFGTSDKDLGNITDGIGGIGDAAQQANKDVLTLIGGFDELNKINVPNADAAGLGGGNILDGITLPEYNIFDQLVENKVDEIVKKINESFKELAQTLKDMGINEVVEDFKRFGEQIWEQINQYDFGGELKNALLAAVDLAISAVNLSNKLILPLVVALDIPGIVYEAINTFTSFLGMLDSVVESVTPGIQTFVDRALVPMAEWLGGKIKDGLQFMSDELEKLGQWFRGHTEEFTVLGEKLGEIAGGLWEFIEPLADAAWENFKNLISRIYDIFKSWGDAILPIVTHFLDLVAQMGEFMEATGITAEIVEFFKEQIDALGVILQGVLGVLEGIGLFLIGTFTNNWETAWAGIETIVDGSTGVLKGLLELTLGDMSDGVLAFLGDVSAAFDDGNWKKPWENAWDRIVSIVKKDMATIRGENTSSLNQIEVDSTNHWGRIESNANQTWENIKSSLSRQLDDVSRNWNESWSNIRNKGSETWSQIRQLFSETTENLKSTASSFVSNLKSTWTSGWNSIKSTFTSVVNGIKSAATSAFSSITSAVSSMISKIKDAISRLKDLFSWKDKTDDLDFGDGNTGGLKGIAALKAANGVSYTTFASGGVVSEPTYALVGEYASAKNNPEIIAPQNVIEQSVVNANGDMVGALYDMAVMIVTAIEDNSVTVEGDADAMFRAVRKRGVDYQKNTGKPVFAP